MSTQQRYFDEPALEQACRLARLQLSDERKAVLGPMIQRMYADIDTLDQVEIGETPPATAFDARWE